MLNTISTYIAGLCYWLHFLPIVPCFTSLNRGMSRVRIDANRFRTGASRFFLAANGLVPGANSIQLSAALIAALLCSVLLLMDDIVSDAYMILK